MSGYDRQNEKTKYTKIPSAKEITGLDKRNLVNNLPKMNISDKSAHIKVVSEQEYHKQLEDTISSQYFPFFLDVSNNNEDVNDGSQLDNDVLEKKSSKSISTVTKNRSLTEIHNTFNSKQNKNAQDLNQQYLDTSKGRAWWMAEGKQREMNVQAQRDNSVGSDGVLNWVSSNTFDRSPLFFNPNYYDSNKNPSKQDRNMHIRSNSGNMSTNTEIPQITDKTKVKEKRVKRTKSDRKNSHHQLVELNDEKNTKLMTIEKKPEINVANTRFPDGYRAPGSNIVLGASSVAILEQAYNANIGKNREQYELLGMSTNEMAQDIMDRRSRKQQSRNYLDKRTPQDIVRDNDPLLYMSISDMNIRDTESKTVLKPTIVKQYLEIDTRRTSTGTTEKNQFKKSLIHHDIEDIEIMEDSSDSDSDGDEDAFTVLTYGRLVIISTLPTSKPDFT